MPANNRKPPAKMLEEARKCYELQVAGFSTYQIAEKMGFSQKTVRNRIDMHILKRVHPNVDQMRTSQITRLEAYIRSLWDKAMSGDEKAINAAIRTEERIAKLFGTDSATAFVVKADVSNQYTDHIHFLKMIDDFQDKKGEDNSGTRAEIAEVEQAHAEGRPVPRRRRRPLAEWVNNGGPMPGSTAGQTAPHNPETEFAKDNTFAPHEVREEAVTLSEDIEEFEPEPRPTNRPRRGKPVQNPAHQFLRDSDDD